MTDDLKRAREIAATVLRGRGMPSPTAEADMVERGEWDHHGYVEGALAAIRAEREAVVAALRRVAESSGEWKEKEGLRACAAIIEKGAHHPAIERGDHHHDRNG